MKSLFLLAFLAATPALMAQSPILQTIAYSRDTTSGIPARDKSAAAQRPPLKTDYFIYVVVKKGLRLSSTGACVRGRFFSVILHKVDAPVRVDHDASVPTGVKDTLVGPTSDDVYHLELTPQQNSDCPAHDGPALNESHAVVISLNSGQSVFYGVADKIVALRPAAGM